MYLLNEAHALQSLQSLQSLHCNVFYNDPFWVINNYECMG